MQNSITIPELKPDMVVQTRDGRCYVVIGHWLYGTSSVINKYYYEDDLTMKNYPWNDIVKIYSKSAFKNFIDNYSAEVIWERELSEIKEVTMAEVEDKFGCKVKIINE